MKRLWIGSLALAAGLAAAPVAFAQDGGTPTPPAGGQGSTPPPPAPPPAPGGDQGGGRQRGGGRGGMGLPVDRLKEDLGLTDEQVTQIEAINKEVRDKAREMFSNGQGLEGMKAMMEETYAKVEALLTPEQKTKFGEFKTRMQERMQGRGGPGGGRGGPGGGRGGPQLKERLREDALKALALSQEEAAVVTPRLDTVLDTRDLTQRESQRARDEFMTKVRETTDQPALQKLLADYRTAREQGKAQEKTAMDQLRELLTVEQEAKLVGLGILD